MVDARREAAAARAADARKRARRARERAAENLAQGEAYFAHVQEALARAEELVVENAELTIARLTPEVPVPAIDRPARLWLAHERALAFAQVHRDRGQFARAHYQEDAAGSFAVLARCFEEHTADTESTGHLAGVERNAMPATVGETADAEQAA